MPTRHLLYQKDIPINDYIRVMIPTVGEVLENEEIIIRTTERY